MNDVMENTPKVTLEFSDFSINTLELEKPFDHCYRYELGNTTNLPKISSFDIPKTTLPIHHFIFDNVLFDPARATIIQCKNSQVWTMNPFFFPTEADEVFPRAANARAALVGQTAFCGFNRHWANAGHWISDCVPAISSYDSLASAYREDGSNPVILVPPLNPRMLRSLQLIGIDPESVKEVDPNQVIALDRLVVSSLLCGRTAPSPFCSNVYEKMVKRLNVQTPASERTAGRGIYVSRLDGSSRQIRNEQQVIEKLRNRGITPIIVSNMSMDERIEKFSNAEFVVGSHGAGMANISFCHPEAVIYEIFPAHYLQSFHATLAQQVGLHYWADAYSVHEGFPVGCHAPWSIDTDYFEARLDEITNFHKLSF